MRWQKKLTKKEMKHVKETTTRPTIAAIKRNLEAQVELRNKCWECRAIARKLGIEV